MPNVLKKEKLLPPDAPLVILKPTIQIENIVEHHQDSVVSITGHTEATEGPLKIANMTASAPENVSEPTRTIPLEKVVLASQATVSGVEHVMFVRSELVYENLPIVEAAAPAKTKPAKSLRKVAAIKDTPIASKQPGENQVVTETISHADETVSTSEAIPEVTLEEAYNIVASMLQASPVDKTAGELYAEQTEDAVENALKPVAVTELVQEYNIPEETAEQATAFIVTMPEAVKVAVATYFEEQAPEAAQELHEQIVSIAQVAEMLHDLSMSPNPEPETVEALEIWLASEYEKLLDTLGIEASDEAIKMFIELVKSDDYNIKTSVLNSMLYDPMHEHLLEQTALTTNDDDKGSKPQRLYELIKLMMSHTVLAV